MGSNNLICIISSSGVWHYYILQEIRSLSVRGLARSLNQSRLTMSLSKSSKILFWVPNLPGEKYSRTRQKLWECTWKTENDFKFLHHKLMKSLPIKAVKVFQAGTDSYHTDTQTLKAQSKSRKTCSLIWFLLLMFQHQKCLLSVHLMEKCELPEMWSSAIKVSMQQLISDCSL